MRPTIRDVARHAGVSVTTASRVLGGSSHPVAPEMRQKVLRAAEALDFTPNAFARGLSKQHFFIVGLVIPDIRDPYYVEISRGAEDMAGEKGYMVLLCNTDRDPAKEVKYIEELGSMRAGIVLTSGVVGRTEPLESLTSYPAPVVVIGRHPLPFSSVRIDNLQGGVDATNYLLQLGYRRIACITGPEIATAAADRLRGFRLSMEQHDVPADEDLLAFSDFTAEGGALTFRRMMDEASPPEAIFATNDQMAIGILREAKQHGLRIPEDLAVVGFNDIAMASYVDPPLTTMHLPLESIGRMAADLLVRQLNTGQAESTHVEVKGELVVRGSTRAIGTKTQ